MSTTVLAVPGAFSRVTGSNGKIYDVVGGLVQVTTTTDVNALRDVGAFVVTFPKGDAGDKGSNAITAVNPQTGVTYAITAPDQNTLITFNSADPVAVSIPQATGTYDNGFALFAANAGVGDVVVTPATSTIKGASTFTLATGEAAIIISDGTNWKVITGLGV